jgi:hypothetical protein
MQITKPMAKAISMMKEHGTLERVITETGHYNVFMPNNCDYLVEGCVYAPTISRLIMAGLAEWTDSTKQVVRYIDKDNEIGSAISTPTISQLFMAGFAELADSAKQVVRYIDKDNEIAIVNAMADMRTPTARVKREFAVMVTNFCCPHCGSKLDDTDRFCSWCGKALKGMEEISDETTNDTQEEAGDADGSSEEEQVQFQED